MPLYRKRRRAPRRTRSRFPPQADLGMGLLLIGFVLLPVYHTLTAWGVNSIVALIIGLLAVTFIVDRIHRLM